VSPGSKVLDCSSAFFSFFFSFFFPFSLRFFVDQVSSGRSELGSFTSPFSFFSLFLLSSLRLTCRSEEQCGSKGRLSDKGLSLLLFLTLLFSSFFFPFGAARKQRRGMGGHGLTVNGRRQYFFLFFLFLYFIPPRGCWEGNKGRKGGTSRGRGTFPSSLLPSFPPLLFSGKEVVTCER